MQILSLWTVFTSKPLEHGASFLWFGVVSTEGPYQHRLVQIQIDRNEEEEHVSCLCCSHFDLLKLCTLQSCHREETVAGYHLLTAVY